MTPQEELFAKFFKDEKMRVKDMDMLQLRAHREELAKIAFEARARLTAVDDAEKERKPSSSDKGFRRSLNTDETSSNAINKIQERQGKMTKLERSVQDLVSKGYMSQEDADRMLTSKNVLDAETKRVQDKTPQASPRQFENSPEVQASIDAAKAEEAIIDAKPKAKPAASFNPFAKK